MDCYVFDEVCNFSDNFSSCGLWYLPVGELVVVCVLVAVWPYRLLPVRSLGPVGVEPRGAVAAPHDVPCAKRVAEASLAALGLPGTTTASSHRCRRRRALPCTPGEPLQTATHHPSARRNAFCADGACGMTDYPLPVEARIAYAFWRWLFSLHEGRQVDVLQR